MASLRNNFAFNIINTITSLLFPILTFPYASRILLADGIGVVNFYSSIINYIILLTSLGIPLYAVREIAKIRDNIKECTKVTIEILLLNFLLIVGGYIIVAVLIACVYKIQLNVPLFLILSSSILISSFGIEWFYQGTEDFKYITIRGIIVKTLSVAFLFLFVKTPDDILWYGVYTVIGTVGGNFFNIVRLKSKIDCSVISFRELDLFRHLKPALKLFVLNLIVSIYINLDTVMLGFIKSDAAVGYYTGAVKLTRCVLGIVAALQTVMIPRFSNLIANDNKKDFNRLCQKVYDFVIMISIPLSIGLVVLSGPIIILFCGDSYKPSIAVLQIIASIILWVGISGVFGIQILFPQGKEKIVIICTGIGALINFSLNCMLIPIFAQNGAAFASVVAELCVTLSTYIIARKYLPVRYFDRSVLQSIIASVIMGIAIVLVSGIFDNLFISLISTVLIGILIYVLVLYAFKNSLLMSIISKNRRK